MRLAIPVTLFFALACSGGAPPAPEPEPAVEAPAPEPGPAPEPEPEVDWVETAIDRALDMEEMPGTTGDRSDERRAALRSFFEAHPEYEAEAELEKLADLACAFGIEDAHEKRKNPEPDTPVTIEVDADGWKAVVAHAEDHCTSDDWSWFTNEVAEAAGQHDVKWDYAGAGNDVVVVMRDGAEVQRVPLSGQGYLVLQDGKEPGHVGHDIAESVIAEIGQILGW